MSTGSLIQQHSVESSLNTEKDRSISVTESDPFLTPAATSVNETNVAPSPPTRTPDVTMKKTIHGSHSQALQPRPLLGILALCLTACCVLFSLAILIASNNQRIDTWSVQPTVYLAIAAAIANSAISFAYAQAVVVTWWFRATKGATIRQLEHQWEVSTSLLHAIIQCRHVSVAVIASVLVNLMIIDGALLQRASSVKTATQSELVTFNLTLAPEIPTGFSGISAYNVIQMSQSVIQVCQEWQKQTPILLALDPPCDGRCVGKINGPGVTATNCSTRTWPITYDMYHDPNATWGSWSGVAPISSTPGLPNNPIFLIFLILHDVGDGRASMSNEAAYLTVGRISVFEGSGNYTETSCFWVPAILSYDVAFSSDGSVSILPDPGSSGQVVSLANNTQAGDARGSASAQPETMDFLTEYLSAFVQVNASADAPVPNATDGVSNVWDDDVATYNAQVFKYENYSNGPIDNNFLDPTLDIIHSLNEMMFRSAVIGTQWPNITELIDPGLSVHQSTVANQTVTRNVFHSDFRWYAAATALEIIVVLTVLPMFWGYWTLNKHLNFSPFGMGLAFDAPLLRDVDPEKGAAGVVKQLGDRHVRFGVHIEEVQDTTHFGKAGRKGSSSGSQDDNDGEAV